VPTVACPTVRDKLPAVPARSRAAVDRQVTKLDRAQAAANDRIAASRGQIDAGFTTSVIGPLRAQRAAALRQISRLLNGRPVRLVSLVECEVERLVQAPGDGGVLGALQSKRTATIGRIVIAIDRRAPRPQLLEQLAACTVGKGQDAGAGQDAGGEKELPAPSGPNLELPGNTGGIVRPAAVLIEYRGNPTGKVTAMPRFLRALTGDAKPTSRGPANARATWTCSGFGDRLSDKYPICPAGRQVQRVQDFPGCWNGKDTDSANHRAHLAFADRAGACPAGFQAIPQLRITISYAIPRAVQEKGQYALDSFPEENHNPFSDHNDFVNVNSARQMATIAACLNSGKRCR
jgi:hypothetical protein